MTYLNEDTLVQQTTADYLHDHLRWDSVYAYNKETLGPDGLLGRNSDREVVLTRYLKEALKKLNPHLPETAYDEAVRQVVDYSQSQSMLSSNFDKYKLFKDGVLVSFQGEHGEIKKERLKIFDFNEATNNHFLAVRELWMQGDLYRRRIDIAQPRRGQPWTKDKLSTRLRRTFCPQRQVTHCKKLPSESFGLPLQRKRYLKNAANKGAVSKG
jgi:type I restriction enzyme R subunit